MDYLKAYRLANSAIERAENGDLAGARSALTSGSEAISCYYGPSTLRSLIASICDLEKKNQLSCLLTIPRHFDII